VSDVQQDDIRLCLADRVDGVHPVAVATIVMSSAALRMSPDWFRIPQ
jgi:hypothetical protein